MDITKATFLNIGHLEHPGGWRMAAHSHGVHELIVVCKGRLTAASSRGTLTGRTGEALLYPAGLRHKEWSEGDGPLETYFASFSMDGLGRSVPLRSSDPDGRLRQIMRWLSADQHLSGEAAASHRDALMTAVMAEYAKNCAGREDALVKAARDHIRAHLADRLSLDSLSKRMGMSKFHFLREYKRLSGTTPWEDVRRLRAEHARGMIMSTPLSFKEIAPLCGLGTEFAMCRLFRRIFGMTPGELRRFSGKAH